MQNEKESITLKMEELSTNNDALNAKINEMQQQQQSIIL